MQLDLRSKLTVFLCTVFLVSALSKDTVFFLLIVLLCVYIFILGYGKVMVRLIAVIAVIEILRRLTNRNGLGAFLPDMFLFIALRTLVITLSVIPVLKTPPGELMAVMRKFRIHRNFSLPLIFMLRFLPVVRSEFAEIIDSLRLRGLLSIKKPLTAMEYLFVPMMFSASKIAEELAAASEVRGISANGAHSSRREIKFRRADFFVVFAAVLFTVGLYGMESVLTA